MKQPEALRLADELPMPIFAPEAAELRRLHKVNQMLLEALNAIADETYDSWTNGAIAQQTAKAAIETAGEA